MVSFDFEVMGLAVTVPRKKNRTVLGMGVDSALVLVVYVGGMLLYYQLTN